MEGCFRAKAIDIIANETGYLVQFESAFDFRSSQRELRIETDEDGILVETSDWK